MFWINDQRIHWSDFLINHQSALCEQPHNIYSSVKFLSWFFYLELWNLFFIAGNEKHATCDDNVLKSVHFLHYRKLKISISMIKFPAIMDMICFSTYFCLTHIWNWKVEKLNEFLIVFVKTNRMKPLKTQWLESDITSYQENFTIIQLLSVTRYGSFLVDSGQAVGHCRTSITVDRTILDQKNHRPLEWTLAKTSATVSNRIDCDQQYLLGIKLIICFARCDGLGERLSWSY